jgi:hypothetical protein
MKTYYVIQIIGYGAKQRFCIKEVVKEDKQLGSTTLLVTNGRSYRSESGARRAAEEMGIEIALVGDLYQII